MPARRQPTPHVTVEQAIDWLRENGTQDTIDGMARYGIPSANALGVTVGAMKGYAKQIGRDHELALKLWDSGYYEARMLAGFVDDPAQVDGAQMDRWAANLDSWAVCDSVCFHLFDRTAPRWEKVHAWAHADAEFVKRAAFAILWGLSVHDKQADDATFTACLPLIETAAGDDRDHVRKGVDMALRAMGKRNAMLRSAAMGLAERMADSQDRSRRWVGRSTLRELSKLQRAKGA